MKWIKASERLPETGIGFLKYVWVRNTDTKCGCMHALESLLKLDGLNNIEWLDESTPVPDKVEFAATHWATINDEQISSFVSELKRAFIAGANWQSTQPDAGRWVEDEGHG